MAMSNAHTTPVEIDTAIAESLHRLSKLDRDVKLQESFLAEPADSYRRHHYDEEKYGKALEAFDAENAVNNALQAKYTGWSRYWHVTNNNGHIHTSQSCTTCFPDTRYAWRTDLSGLTPEQVVEREAYNACSMCMPIAPAEQRAARKRYTEEQRAAKRAEKDAKANEKARKAAERAVKLLAKVEAWYESFGGYEAAMSLPNSHEASLYSAVYGFGSYSDRKEAPSTVADVILDDQHEHQGQSRYNKDPRKIIADAREKGLI